MRELQYNVRTPIYEKEILELDKFREIIYKPLTSSLREEYRTNNKPKTRIYVSLKS